MDWFQDIGFEQPWYLVLLVLVPFIAILSYKSLAGLGPTRRWVAILFRSIVFAGLVAALAEIHWRETTNRLTVMYVLDLSESIPIEQREAMLTYVKQSVERHRRQSTSDEESDKAGVIIFGASAAIEAAPFAGSLPLADRFEAGVELKTDATNLESALRLAKAAFTEDSAKRIVVVTDGNQNVGDSAVIAQTLASDGIGIDVVPVKLERVSDVAVDRLLVPNDIRNGQKFEARVVINNDTIPTESNPNGEVSGRLVLTQTISQREETIAEQQVTLEPGKNVITFDHELTRSAVVTFAARFVADDPTVDSIVRNNEASSFAQVRGEGRVLLIEDASSPGEFQQLIETLTEAKILVDVKTSDAPFSSAAELLQYDSVILANVARATEDSSANAVAFSDAQIQMLVDNCEELGCGIVMIGGDRAFGAGGWANTDLEKAMPVDFQIKNDKISAVGALAMIMHASEMSQGNFWQVKVGQEALNVLGPMDFCGVVDWSDMTANPRWLWQLPGGIDRVGPNKKRMNALMNRMVPGDMMEFDTPMKLALTGLKACPASMKHMIIISDGDPAPPTQALLNQYIAAKVKISTVAIGTHGPAGSSLLKNIATKTGGKYYEVTDAKALPKIYQREARRVAKPVVKESKQGMNAIDVSSGIRNEIMLGISSQEIPPFYGYVMTTVKKNPLVQQLLIAGDPPDNVDNTTLLATWRYGVGRTVAFSSDAGNNWTTDWYNTGVYKKLFSQMVRYSMRPVTNSANFVVGTDVRDNKAKVVVTALDDNDEFLNFLALSARGIGPDSNGFNLDFSQTAPGRYEAEFDTNSPGNYLFSIFPGEGYERLTSGVNVPYSTEFSDRETNESLIDRIAGMEIRNSKNTGMRSEYLTTRTALEGPLELNPFRPDLVQATAIQPMWPQFLLITAWLFLMDVFIRRVSVNLNVFAWLYQKVRERLVGKEAVDLTSNMERLRSKKSEVSRQLESSRKEMRFEPEVDMAPHRSGTDHLASVLESEREKETEPPAPKVVQNVDPKKDETTHTSRLLDAKRKLRRERDNEK
ncbi:MAG: VWA domain-containing protein [Pirellulaceae bacterium]